MKDWLIHSDVYEVAKICSFHAVSPRQQAVEKAVNKKIS
jgi:hypothetical protein